MNIKLHYITLYYIILLQTSHIQENNITCIIFTSTNCSCLFFHVYKGNRKKILSTKMLAKIFSIHYTFMSTMKLSNKVLCLSLLKNFSSKFAHTDRNFNKVLYFYPGLHRQISNFIVNKITIYCNSNILGG